MIPAEIFVVLAWLWQGKTDEAKRQFKAFCQGVSGLLIIHQFSDFERGMLCLLGNTPYANSVMLDRLDEQFTSKTTGEAIEDAG